MANNNVKQPLTKFQLNNEIKTSFEIGQVVPFFWRDTVPGDIFRNNTNFTVRFMPLISPVMHKLDLHAHFYFVPYRLLDKNFREVLAKPESPLVCKNLTELNISPDEKILDRDNLLRAFGIHSSDSTLPLEAQRVTSSYFLRAYQFIYNYFFRHEILDDDYIDDMTSDDLDKFGRKLMEIGYARHGLDYFMSNLPTTQYGSMVELDMDNNGTIRVDEMRLAEKLQYFKERLLTRARGRYKNFLDTFFGVSPTNMELQQPDYLGGGSQMLDVVDVDQTASYEIEQYISPLGSQAGKINNNKFGYNFKYRTEEHGIILGLCWVLPRANYIQGVPREFIKQDFYSFYNPTFANLGMQETLGMELSAERKDTFGYNERYAELKYSKDVIAGDFAKLSSWHFGIDLRSEQLSEEFVKVHTDNQPFAVKQITATKKQSLSRFKYISISYDDKFTNMTYSFYGYVPKEVDAQDYLESIFANTGVSESYVDLFQQGKPMAEFPIYPSIDNSFILQIPSEGTDDNLNIRGVPEFIASQVFYSEKQRQNFITTDKIRNNEVNDGLKEYIESGAPFLFAKTYDNQAGYAGQIAAYPYDKGRPLYDIISPYEFDTNSYATNLDVTGNHILLAAYNNCDALRPIPKFAKPSISL